MRCTLFAAILAGTALVISGCGGSSGGGGAPAPSAAGPQGAAAPAAAPSAAPGPAAAAPSPAPGPAVPPGAVLPPTAAAVATPTGTPASRAATIAPYLDDSTIAVIRVDVGKLDIEQAVASFQQIAGDEMTDLEKANQEKMVETGRTIKKHIQEIYLVLSFADFPLNPPLAVVKLAPGGDPKMVYALHKSPNASGPIDEAEFEKSTYLNGDLLAIGNERSIMRVKAPNPANIPQLEPAFQLAGDALVQVAYIPTENARKTLELLMPEMPPQLGFDRKMLVQSLQYGAIGIELLPKPELSVQVQATDADSARRLHEGLGRLMEMAKLQPNLPADAGEILSGLMPELQSEKLSLALKQGNPTYNKLEAQIKEAVAASREAANRMVSSNNLKQIALAMLNHHDAQGKFPLSAPPNSQPGLSWRVHLLPYLGEEELYRQFNLNEPWDSATNKPLVEKMPQVYMHPNVRGLEKGRTVYVVPAGSETVFPPGDALTFAQVRDGTSNTILLLEVDPSRAVIWTQPEDWLSNGTGNPEGLYLWKNRSFLVGMVDGSVHPIRGDVSPDDFRKLLSPRDGQPVDLASIRAGSGDQGFTLRFPGLPGMTGGSAAGPVGPGGIPPGAVPPPGSVPPGAVLPTDPGRNPGAFVPMPVPGSVPGGDAASGDPAAPTDTPLLAEARAAFAEGRDSDAFEFLYASAILREDKYNLLKQMRWVPSLGLKRPALALRIGVAVDYNATKNYAGGPQPIGRVQMGSPPTFTPNGTDSGAPQPGSAPSTVIDYYTSEIGPRILEGLQVRHEQGSFGDVLTLFASSGATGSSPVAPAGPVFGEQRPGARRSTTQPIVPGIVFLGVGKAPELLKKARAEGLDALIVFDVDVKATRTAVVNTTRLNLIEVSKNAALYTPLPLNAITVEKARQDGKADDPVDTAIEKFFEAVDSSLVLEDLPANLPAEAVAARVAKIASSSPESKLGTLVEIVFWQDQGLLDEAKAKEAFETLLGPEQGAKMAGSDDERREVIDRLLPRRAMEQTRPELRGTRGGGARLNINSPP